MTEDSAAIVSEVYARSPIALGNGTFTPDGRLVVSHHPMYETSARVSVFTDRATLAAFPNVEWNTPRRSSEDWLDAVLGLRTDTQGQVWLLDMGTRSGITPKFVVWDCRADKLTRVLRLPPSVFTSCSEPNDFVIDERGGKIYIADEAAGTGGNGSLAALMDVSRPRIVSTDASSPATICTGPTASCRVRTERCTSSSVSCRMHRRSMMARIAAGRRSSSSASAGARVAGRADLR